ncbi:MAG: hypothetical protein JW946_02720 [Candidatus Omnitrophica bacterium]|nr:hypothetical protein [Candidatus Omnitrophota bacterium]
MIDKIKRLIAKEILIIAALAILLYVFNFVFLKHVPVVLPKYQLEFANGQKSVINITPEIRNDSDYRKLLEETYAPSQKLIDKRAKEFIKASRIRSALKSSTCINNNQIYLSRLYSRFLGVAFILKLAAIYVILLFFRFAICLGTKATCRLPK